MSGNRPEAGGSGGPRTAPPGSPVSVEEARGLFAAELSESEAAASPRGGFLPADVAALKVRWLGKKQGVVTALLARLKEVPKEEKAAFGAGVNALKQEVEARLDALEAEALGPRRGARRGGEGRGRHASAAGAARWGACTR